MNKATPERVDSVTDVNHLSSEKSPYLLQHADNPVHWYPWGEEAFKKAENQDKPVFLSIGYSTCHWCHVMEHESFENAEIAEMLNQHFVSIKVDREERPDIDNVYMKVVMAITGNGGWPLTVFLTPDKKPFFGGTYFPPDSRWGKPGFKDLLFSINDQWHRNRAEIVKSGESLTQAIRESLSRKLDKDFSLDINTLHLAYKRFQGNFDETYGGFGDAPKFPSSHNLSFLLRYWRRTGEKQALIMVRKSLSEMAEGGIYDHIGGGFHRYSTDRTWHIPHFEKMLYDQAMLSKAYLEAYQATGDERYAQVAREIFDYVLRDMTGPAGGFYSAEDADSFPPDEFKDMSADSSQSHEKKEGAFYVWRQQELIQILGKEAANIFIDYFGVKEDGNAINDPHQEFIGKNILYIAHPIRAVANKFHKMPKEIENILKGSKEKLFLIRSKRPKPHLDDKVLVDWNGLMISSLAFGSRVLNEPRYREAAERSAQFILKKMVGRDGRLLHRFRDNDASVRGTIEDYSFFILGLIDLYEATFKPEYLLQAKHFANDMVRFFEDEEGGGFFFTAEDAEELLFKDKEIYDGAIPSGNSIAALDVLRLWRYTLNNQWEKYANGIFDSFSEEILRAPDMYAQTLIALDFAIGPSKEIVLAEGEDKGETQRILKTLYTTFVPNKIIIFRPFVEQEASVIISLVPFIANQVARERKATIYVCENYVCQFPTSDLKKFKELLE